MATKPANQKRRNNEKRKEKSRVAARCRRTKEMEIFAELTAALPAKKEEVEQLDKASVMRLAISYLKVRDVVSLLPDVDKEVAVEQTPKEIVELSSELSYMKALDGFVFVLSQQGDIVYCSENIADHLGVSQMEIMGQSVFEFSHPCDHDEIREALRSSDSTRRELLLRLKCTLTSKGRNVHLKSASYKVIHVTGHMLSAKNDKAEKVEEDKKDGDEKKLKNGTLVAVGRPIPHPSNIEIPLDSKTFLTKHSLDMKFTYTDDALQNTLGFEPGDMVGNSLFDYHHAADSASLIHQYKSLFSKGQCETGQYRFLAKSGGYAWVQTQATVITDKQQKPISVVCVNYIISGIECKDDVFAAHQLQHADLKPIVVQKEPIPAELAVPIDIDLPNGAIVGTINPEEDCPMPVTDSIFVPREEMNEGYLMFSEDEGHTSEWNTNTHSLVLKDEPEDLTHLAPTAGDSCIPLENSSYLPPMFEDYLNDNYPILLGDDLDNGSPVDSIADSLLLSSPETHETESSSEQSLLLTELSLDTLDGSRSDNDIDDPKSPFLSGAEDLPVLESFCSEPLGKVMWGALPDNVSLARPQPSEVHTTSPAPALQRLLTGPPTGPPPQDLITNIYSDSGLIPNRSVTSWDTGVKRVRTQEEEPTAKRVKRSPSPVAKQTSSPSSSVLMNLLELQQAQQVNAVRYQMHMNQQKRGQIIPNRNTIPVPVMNLLQVSNNQILRANSPMYTNPMSPLSLNVPSPMYSLPSSPSTPNYSPAMSPAQRDRILSPYSAQSLSPAGKYPYSPNSMSMSPVGVMQGDPYLTHKMQPSPCFPIQTDFLDTSMSLSSDFWTDTEVLQNANDLLTAFDDVKLG